MKKKIGLWGGSFDPVHKGHLHGFKEVISSGLIDELWIVPAYKSFRGKKLEDYKHRVKMLELATESLDNVKICTSEGEVKKARTDLEKVKWIKKKYENFSFYWVYGSDLFSKVVKNKEIYDMKKYVHIIAHHRNGFEAKKLAKKENVPYIGLGHKQYTSSTSIKLNKKGSEKMEITEVKSYIDKYRLYRIAKVAVVHPFFLERGGAERKSLLMAKGAQDSNFLIDIITFEKNEKKCFSEFMNELNFIEIGYRRSFAGKLYKIYELSTYLKNYDVIHAHNYPANLSAAIAKIRYGTPVIYYCNEPFLHLEGTTRRVNKLLLPLLRYVEKLLMRKIDIIVANSKFTASNIKKAFNRHSYIEYSGIDTTILKPRNKHNEKPVILTINRITKEKHLDGLKEIMNLVWEVYPDAELRVGGSGDYQKELKKKLDDKRIKFLGALDFENVVKNYQTADVFVFTAHNEPLGMTPVEAMSCGTPVVAHNSGGPRETVKHAKTGFLVNNEKEFADRIIQLLSDKKMYEEMSKNARQRVLKDFSLERMVNGAISYYKKLLKNKGNQNSK